MVLIVFYWPVICYIVDEIIIKDLGISWFLSTSPFLLPPHLFPFLHQGRTNGEKTHVSLMPCRPASCAIFILSSCCPIALLQAPADNLPSLPGRALLLSIGRWRIECAERECHPLEKTGYQRYRLIAIALEFYIITFLLITYLTRNLIIAILN